MGLVAGAADGGVARPQARPAAAQPTAPQPLSDADFSAALPSLDSMAPPPASPLPAPPARTPPPPPAAAIAPVTTDADLTQPLQPLASFNATPPAETASQAGRGAEPKKLRYRVDISGLKQAGLEPQFRSLSTLVQDGSKAANLAQIRARANEDVALAERLLHSQGYYDGLATATVPPALPAGDTPVAVTVAATPGPRYSLSSVTITRATGDPLGLARNALALKPGDPIVSDAIQTGEAQVALRLPEQGYPFVKVGDRDILLDGDAHNGAYTLPVNTGPKSSFGSLRTTGDPVFALDHLAVFPRFKEGQSYDSRKADDLRQALIATGLFRTISVEPVDTHTTNADGTERVDLLVNQLRGKPRTIAGSLGYATGQGLTATAEWTHRNLFPPEGALIVDVTAGTQQQAVGATFRRSNAGKRDRTFQASATVSRQRFDAYDAETATLGASIARQSTPIWQKRWTYSIGTELTATRETPFDPADLTRPKNTYFLAALPLQGGYDATRNLLDPTSGFRVSGKLTPTVQKQSGGGFDKYLYMLGETSAYYPIGSSIVLAARGRVGSIVGADRDDIAPSRRLYSGGGGSVRGFGYQQLGPKDASNNPIGGRSLTEFAGEARYRFGNYGVVSFLDAGRVGASSKPSISGMRYGVGIGGRYYTNFGPFRLDVATPLGRKKGESKVAVYISIGQAF